MELKRIIKPNDMSNVELIHPVVRATISYEPDDGEVKRYWFKDAILYRDFFYYPSDKDLSDRLNELTNDIYFYDGKTQDEFMGQ